MLHHEKDCPLKNYLPLPGLCWGWLSEACALSCLLRDGARDPRGCDRGADGRFGGA